MTETQTCELCGIQTYIREKINGLMACINCHEQMLRLEYDYHNQLNKARLYHDKDITSLHKQLEEVRRNHVRDIADIRDTYFQALTDFRKEKARDKQDR